MMRTLIVEWASTQALVPAITESVQNFNRLYSFHQHH